MSKNTIDKDTLFGAVGVIAGLIGVGYAIGTHTKLSKISERLDRSIEELSNDMNIDIPEDIIKRAVERAVAAEAKKAVEKATTDALAELKRDIRTTVVAAVDKEYETLKDSVLTEITNSASKIDVTKVRRDVESAAKKAALDKFDDNLDDILEKFNNELDNTSKIYRSIAQTMTPQATDRDIRLRLV